MEAPRVNASMLPKYSGKMVCLVGNVTEVRRVLNFSLVFRRCICRKQQTPLSFSLYFDRFLKKKGLDTNKRAVKEDWLWFAILSGKILRIKRTQSGKANRIRSRSQI